MTESFAASWKEIAASFLPSFVMMLALMPAFERMRSLAWARAVIQGIVPAVVGVMAVALLRMAPYAGPDTPAIAVFVVTAAVLIVWRLAPLTRPVPRRGSSSSRSDRSTP